MCLVAGVCGWEYTRTCGLKNSAGRQRTAEGEKKRRRAANESQVQGTRMRWKSAASLRILRVALLPVAGKGREEPTEVAI